MANKKKRPQRAGEGRQAARSQPRQQAAPQPRQARSRQKPKAAGSLSRNTMVMLVGGVAVLAVLVLVLLSISGAFGGTQTVGATSIKGNPDAKVVVEEFSDFQCPFCARFAVDTFPKIDMDYIETGKVKWVFKHFARIGEESKQAAIAAECAGEQQQFWPYHDKLFTSQQGENKGAFNSDKLKSLAKTLGLNQEAFNSCLDSGRYGSLVEQNRVEANQKGVKGTPSFFVNGVMLEGALPYSEFQKAIDTALAK